MPHDRKGNELHVGDIVSVPCRVREVFATEFACNVQLETVEKMPQGEDYPASPTGITLNTKQVDLVRTA